MVKPEFRLFKIRVGSQAPACLPEGDKNTPPAGNAILSSEAKDWGQDSNQGQATTEGIWPSTQGMQRGGRACSATVT